MAHWVKCLYCGEGFDRDKEKFIKIGRRYSHPQCAEAHDANMSQEERDYEELIKYCKILFGEDFNYVMTKKLIEKYKKEYDYSYSGMKKCLQWFYEIKGNSIEKANGSCGIIPYVYKDSYNYYYNLYLTTERNKDYVKEAVPAREIDIASPRQRVKTKKLWFDDDEQIGEI